MEQEYKCGVCEKVIKKVSPHMRSAVTKGHRIYCSQSCRKQAGIQNKKRLAENMQPIPCSKCGEMYKPTPDQYYAHKSGRSATICPVCHKQNHTIFCSKCRRPFVGTTSQYWRSRQGKNVLCGKPSCVQGEKVNVAPRVLMACPWSSGKIDTQCRTVAVW